MGERHGRAVPLAPLFHKGPAVIAEQHVGLAHLARVPRSDAVFEHDMVAVVEARVGHLRADRVATFPASPTAAIRGVVAPLGILKNLAGDAPAGTILEQVVLGIVGAEDFGVGVLRVPRADSAHDVVMRPGQLDGRGVVAAAAGAVYAEPFQHEVVVLIQEHRLPPVLTVDFHPAVVQGLDGDRLLRRTLQTLRRPNHRTIARVPSVQQQQRVAGSCLLPEVGDLKWAGLRAAVPASGRRCIIR